jgi:DNA-binding NarL/FixJ family response regulator
MIKVIILDDHQLFIDGLINSFRNDKQIEVIDFALDGVSGIRKIENLRPDVLILDISFSKTGENGVDILKSVKKSKLPVKTLVLTSFCDKSLIDQVRQEGAEGFRIKNIGIDELRQTIIDIYHGEIIFKFDSNLIGLNELVISSRISERAIEIIKLLSEGLIVKEIAQKLGIAETTVNDHIDRTRRKIGAKNTSELIYLAVKNRLI